MDGLVPAFKDSMFDSGIVDSAIDIAEIGLDEIIVNGVLQEIPIVKTLYGVGRFFLSVRDLNFLKQTLHFFSHLHDGSIDSEKFAKYKKSLEEDSKKAEKELSRVIVLLDRTIDDEKSFILASFYRAYIKNAITWEKFCELSEALDRLFIVDIQLLSNVAKSENIVLYEEGGYSAERLVSVGLVQNPTSNLSIGFGGMAPFGKIPLNLTSFGRTFFQFYSEKSKNS